jgi:hypothetical protein
MTPLRSRRSAPPFAISNPIMDGSIKCKIAHMTCKVRPLPSSVGLAGRKGHIIDMDLPISALGFPNVEPGLGPTETPSVPLRGRRGRECRTRGHRTVNKTFFLCPAWWFAPRDSVYLWLALSLRHPLPPSLALLSFLEHILDIQNVHSCNIFQH